MSESLKAIFASTFSIVGSKTTEIIDSNEKANWIPLLSVPGLKSILGVTKDGFWCKEEPQGLYIFKSSTSYFRIIALTELPLIELRKEIQRQFSLFNIDTDVDLVFPFKEIIEIGFTTGIEHWANLAFNWYDELQSAHKHIFKECLSRVMNAEWSTQKLRHKTIKELRNLGLSGEQIAARKIYHENASLE